MSTQILKAYGDRIAGMEADLAAFRQREARLRQALEKIRRDYGRVCEDFELCSHPACESSVGAWFEADAALRETPAEDGPSGGSDHAER